MIWKLSISWSYFFEQLFFFNYDKMLKLGLNILNKDIFKNLIKGLILWTSIIYIIKITMY